MAGLSGLSGLSGEPGIFGGAAFAGAYDAIPNLVHVYEPARRTLTSYTGNLIRLRRDSDNGESDFGYLGNGDLDTSSITTWLGGANGYIVTVYDQVGSDNITQANTADQPTYVASAKNVHAGISFGGPNHVLVGAFTVSGALSQPFSTFMVAQLTAGAVNDGNYHYILDGDDLTNRMIVRQYSPATPDSWSIQAGAALHDGDSDSNWNIWAVLWNGASSQYWLNGTSKASGNAGAQNPDGVAVGAHQSASFGWNGYIVSVVICDPSLNDAQRGMMQTAMNTYWACY